MEEVYKMSQSTTSLPNSPKHSLRPTDTLEKKSSKEHRCSKGWRKRRNCKKRSIYGCWPRKREKKDPQPQARGENHEPDHIRPHHIPPAPTAAPTTKPPKKECKPAANDDKKTKDNFANLEWEPNDESK